MSRLFGNVGSFDLSPVWVVARVVGREQQMTSWWFVSLLPVEEEAASADGDVGEEGDDHLVGLRDQGGRDQPSRERGG